MLVKRIRFWLKFVFKVKISLKYPKKANILIVDNEGSKEVKTILNIKNSEILHTRNEIFSFPIILILAIKFKLTTLNYYIKYIEISDPKLILLL